MARFAWLLTVLYPALIYVGYRLHLPPASLALVLLPLLFWRAKVIGGGWLLPLCIVAIGMAAATLSSHIPLLLYPVAVNAALLITFAASLVHPPTVVERMARLRHPELPQSASVYLRNVTLAWCAFFACNGAVALFTVFHGGQWWFWYNGVIAYVLIGLMFAGEWLVRGHVVRQSHD
jgi:uncharacterized membrane protein